MVLDVVGKYTKLMLKAVQVDKFLQVMGDFWYANFDSARHKIKEAAEDEIRRARGEYVNQSAMAMKTVFQVNQDRSLLEDHLKIATNELEGKVSLLQGELDKTKDELERAREMYSEQFDRARISDEVAQARAPVKIMPTISKVFADFYRSKEPTLLAGINGVILGINFDEGNNLVGLNYITYLVENRFPPAANHGFGDKVNRVKIGRHVYGIKNVAYVRVGNESYFKLVELRKEGLYESLVQGLQNAVRALHLKRSKPQET